MNGLLIFRMVTAWVTLGLVVFVLWITDGSTIGRVISACVVLFGLLQWWILRRMSHQIVAEPVAEVEEREETV